MNIKNAKISKRILSQVNLGKSLPEAIDLVLGKGSYVKLVDELYAELRA